MDNNPLKQYFRRPAVYLTLPSKGVGYPVGALELPPSGELPVYPMTAIDEITTRTPDALFNGTAIVDLIKSCIPNIKDPWSVLNIDLDAIILAIRAAGGDGKMEVESQCPKCTEVTKYDYDLGLAMTKLKSGDYNTLFEIKDLKIKFKPITYKDVNKMSIEQINIQKTISSLDEIKDEGKKKEIEKMMVDQIAEMTFDVLSKTIEYIETPDTRVDNHEFIQDFLKNCDRTTFNIIKDRTFELKAESNLKPIDLKCPKCSNEYQQTINLNPSDFFD